MPYYNNLKYMISDEGHRHRAIKNLKKLRAQLDESIPAKDSEHTLVLSTWNIRDFDKVNRRGFGSRLPEMLFYIAEVISRFDFVAVQEVNRLNEWRDVMKILGSDYDYIASDETDTALGGNGERLMFVYDKRKVWFQNIAGEIVLPNSMLVTDAEDSDGDALSRGKQFRRTPYVCRFQARWFKFSICTVHIYYGSSSGSKLKQRVQEIEKVVDYLSERADQELIAERGMIILGDFNIVHPEHQTMKALEQNGFVVPETLQKPTNFNRDKFYDQIAFKTRQGVIDFIEQEENGKTPNAGIVQLFENIMTENDFNEYEQDARNSPNGSGSSGEDLRDYYRKWKTYQLSDHMPLWARLYVNSSAEYLDELEARIVAS